MAEIGVGSSSGGDSCQRFKGSVELMFVGIKTGLARPSDLWMKYLLLRRGRLCLGPFCICREVARRGILPLSASVDEDMSKGEKPDT